MAPSMEVVQGVPAHGDDYNTNANNGVFVSSPRYEYRGTAPPVEVYTRPDATSGVWTGEATPSPQGAAGYPTFEQGVEMTTISTGAADQPQPQMVYTTGSRISLRPPASPQGGDPYA